jgi:hypothetical protein
MSSPPRRVAPTAQCVRGARDIHHIAVKMPATGKPRPIKPAAVLGPVKTKP